MPHKATDEEIKRAFRKLARKYHPDVAKNKKTAEAKFKEINEANEVLSNPESRSKYDQLGANWKTGAQRSPSPGQPGGRFRGRRPGGRGERSPFEGTGFSDFFEEFFGRRARRSRGPSPFGPRGPLDGAPESADQNTGTFHGQDIQGDILITLDEVLKGATRSISVRQTNPRTGQEETRTYQVRIPTGVQAGQTIRVPGKGVEGVGGARDGDIYLRVRYAQHPDFQTRGTDLVGHLELAPWEAALGATLPVRTLEGAISLKVPAGTQPGYQLRVRGKGLPAGGNQRGDLYVGVSVRIPLRMSEEEERLWRQLATQSTFQPRKAS